MINQINICKKMRIIIKILLFIILFLILNYTKSIANEDSIPRVYIVGDISNMQSKEDERKLTLKYEDEDLRFEAYIKIKLQGTSSLGYEKKNYTINLFKDKEYSEKYKIDVEHGWGEQSKYCLKANWIDKTHSRNIVSARLSAEVQKRYGLFMDSPNNGVIDGFPVEVYSNDEFLGLYTWNIPKDSWLWNLDKDNENNIAIIGDGYTASTAFQEKITNLDEDKWEIEVGKNNQDTIDKFNRVIDFINNSSNEEFKMDFDYYINKDAALNYFIIMNLIYARDNVCNNLAMITYDGNIWYPSLYDLDTTFGTTWQGEIEDTYEGIIGEGTNLWTRLVAIFPDEIVARWYKLRDDVLTKENVLNEFKNFINAIPEEVYIKDEERWGKIPGFGIDQIEEFLDYRIKYMDNYMNSINTIKEIKVSNDLEKINYMKNFDSFNSDGGKLTIYYNDNTTKTIDFSDKDVHISGFDNTVIGNNEITIEYGGQAITYQVNIIKRSMIEVFKSIRTKIFTYIYNLIKKF